jgi:sec-independent protein translocase protein TatA
VRNHIPAARPIKSPSPGNAVNSTRVSLFREDIIWKRIGLQELLVILAIAVLLFGGNKIPEVAKGIGEGIRNFKQALKGDDPAIPR